MSRLAIFPVELIHQLAAQWTDAGAKPLILAQIQVVEPPWHHHCADWAAKCLSTEAGT